jgi:putative sterol carrier protein
MVRFNVPEGIAVDEFFQKIVPEQFQEIAAGTDLSLMAGREFTLQFQVEGRRYCLRVRDGKDLEIVEGGIPKPMIELKVSEADWREAVTGKAEGVIDRFTDPTQVADLNRYNKLLATKGTLHLELKKPGGGVMPVDLVFNGEAKPEVTIKLAMSDWVDMQKGEANGQILFMSGKMQAQGDMVFLISLQSLL